MADGTRRDAANTDKLKEEVEDVYLKIQEEAYKKLQRHAKVFIEECVNFYKTVETRTKYKQILEKEENIGTRQYYRFLSDMARVYNGKKDKENRKKMLNALKCFSKHIDEYANRQISYLYVDEEGGLLLESSQKMYDFIKKYTGNKGRTSLKIFEGMDFTEDNFLKAFGGNIKEEEQDALKPLIASVQKRAENWSPIYRYLYNHDNVFKQFNNAREKGEWYDLDNIEITSDYPSRKAMSNRGDLVEAYVEILFNSREESTINNYNEGEAKSPKRAFWLGHSNEAHILSEERPTHDSIPGSIKGDVKINETTGTVSIGLYLAVKSGSYSTENMKQYIRLALSIRNTPWRDVEKQIRNEVDKPFSETAEKVLLRLYRKTLSRFNEEIKNRRNKSAIF